jgi:hypothetical protein
MERMSSAPATGIEWGCWSVTCKARLARRDFAKRNLPGATCKRTTCIRFAQNACRAWPIAVAGRPALDVSPCLIGGFCPVGDFGDLYGAYIK